MGVWLGGAKDMTFGRGWGPGGRNYGDSFAGGAKVRNVLGQGIEVVESFRRASWPVEVSNMGAKLVALVRAGTDGWSWVGGFPDPCGT